jgi:hypothetical protein
MLLKKIGVINDILLPPDFVEGEKIFGGMGDNWTLQYHPRLHSENDLHIAFHYRGSPPLKSAGEAFRVLLSQSPKVLLDENTDKSAFRPVANILKNIGDALGQASDNQLTNHYQTALNAPLFHLLKLEVTQIMRRKVLAITGIFHRGGVRPEDFGADIGTSYFYGLLYDAAPGNQPCRVEELLLSARTPELFEQYMVSFERMLPTVRWNDM